MCHLFSGGLLVFFQLDKMIILSLVLLIVMLTGCGSSGQSTADVHALSATIDKGSRFAKQGYLVQPGDTLHAIAFRSGQDISELMRVNNLTPPYTLYPGMTINFDTTSEYQDQYKVRVGDSLSLIASRFSKTVAHLARINKIDPPYTITPGQTLFINISKLSSPSKLENNSISPPKISTGPTSKIKRKKRVEPHLKKEYAQEVVQKNNNLPLHYPVTWRWPTQGKVVVAPASKKQIGRGLLIQGKQGQAIVAAADGQVVYAGNALRGYGQLLILRHDADYLSAYAHNQKLLVDEQQFVKAGQRIALMGQSDTSKVQLHFEIRYRGKSVDPRQYLPKR